MIDPRVITEEEAFSTLCESLAVPVPEGAAPSDELLTEALRANLIGLTRPRDSSSTWEPVYVARLTNAVRRRLSPMWPDDGVSWPNSAAISANADVTQSLDSIQR